MDNSHIFTIVFQLACCVLLTSFTRLRSELNGKGDTGFKLSVNDFVIKAAALACKKVPEANSSWNEQAVRRYVSLLLKL